MFSILSDTLAIATRTDRRETSRTIRERYDPAIDKRRRQEDAARDLENIKIRRFFG